MHIHNKTGTALTLLLYAVMLFSLCACAMNPAPKPKNIAVIVKSTTSAFWQAVEQGVRAAATEYNVTVAFSGASDEEDYLSQNELLADAIANKVDAIVLSAIDYYRTAPLVERAAQNGIRVIALDSGVDSEQVDMFIGTDNYAAGKTAAEAAVQGFSDTDPIHIGIVNYSQSTDNGQRREAGFRDYIDSLPNAEITASVNVESNPTSAQAGTLSLLHKYPQINVLVTFNEWTTLGVGNAIQQLQLAEQVKVVGFDSNLQSIGLLESGEMDVLVVQNPFAMGYLSVKYASDCVDAKPTEQTVYTKATPITKESMYEQDNQKILFPFQ